jgi:multidrug resistance efflux pump
MEQEPQPEQEPNAQEAAGQTSQQTPEINFWQELAAYAVNFTGGYAALIFARPDTAAAWKALAAFPNNQASVVPTLRALNHASLADRVVNENGRWSETLTGDASGTLAIGVSVALPGTSGVVVILVAHAVVKDSVVKDLLERLEALSARVPLHQLQRLWDQARTDVLQFSNVLDLLAVLNSREIFMDACMALTNELTARLQADRASFGWLRKGYIRMQAISHMEKFEKKMDAVQLLEAAMEEAYEQDCEVVWPAGKDDTVVARDLRRFVESETAGHAVTVPLRVEQEGIAVMCVERKSRPFTEAELKWLRLCADQIVSRLVALEARDAWFGKRAWRNLRKKLTGLIGVEHTGAKLLGIIGVLALAFLLLGRWPHRVKGEFTLRSETAVVLPAPFEGYLDEIFVESGELVASGQELASLDVRDLLIEKASFAADYDRFVREAEKARAGQALADMRMAEASAQQALARLELVEHRLAQATIRSPFDGAVVEGDHKERSGVPVSRGEVLFKVAQLNGLTIEAEVDERDIDFVRQGANASLVFASRPADEYPARVLRIDPMAQSINGANVFLVHAEIGDGMESWWRPGMTGVIRVDAGKRTPIWLLSRRTLDYLRLRWGW